MGRACHLSGFLRHLQVLVWHGLFVNQMGQADWTLYGLRHWDILPFPTDIWHVTALSKAAHSTNITWIRFSKGTKSVHYSEHALIGGPGLAWWLEYRWWECEFGKKARLLCKYMAIVSIKCKKTRALPKQAPWKPNHRFFDFSLCALTRVFHLQSGP